MVAKDVYHDRNRDDRVRGRKMTGTLGNVAVERLVWARQGKMEEAQSHQSYCGTPAGKTENRNQD